jgi:uncharacterized repeat protein (TIGR03803 family)
MKKSFFAAAQLLVNHTCGTGAVITVLLMLAATSLKASDYTHLHEFAYFADPDDNYPGPGEAREACGLVLSGQTLYGAVWGDGRNGDDIVYKVNVDGSGFSILHVFKGYDGATPYPQLALSGNTLYGVTLEGGTLGQGIVYKINTDGTGFTNVYNFKHDYNSRPGGQLVVSGKTLYGTTYGRGTGGAGIVFRVNTDGSDITTLHHFTHLGTGAENDGLDPECVVMSGNALYGTTAAGGKAEDGTIFRVNIDGTGYADLHDFTDASNEDGDGAFPGLVVSGNTLYGTVYKGGAGNYGAVFQINTDGTGYTNIYSFGHSDGHNPYGGLLLVGQRLYGTTLHGGDYNKGTLFEIGTDGAGFKTIYHFNGKDGEFPKGTLVSSGKTLYGTTESEGTNGIGATVFALTLPPL